MDDCTQARTPQQMQELCRCPVEAGATAATAAAAAAVQLMFAPDRSLHHAIRSLLLRQPAQQSTSMQVTDAGHDKATAAHQGPTPTNSCAAPKLQHRMLLAAGGVVCGHVHHPPFPPKQVAAHPALTQGTTDSRMRPCGRQPLPQNNSLPRTRPCHSCSSMCCASPRTCGCAADRQMARHS